MSIVARLPDGLPAGRAARQLHNVRVGDERRPAQQQPVLDVQRGQHQRRAGRRARRTQAELSHRQRRRLLREQDRRGQRGVRLRYLLIPISLKIFSL